MKEFIAYCLLVLIFASGCSNKDVYSNRSTNCEAKLEFRCECDCEDDDKLTSILKTAGKLVGDDVIIDTIEDK